jgi:hypothetical protein
MRVLNSSTEQNAVREIETTIGTGNCRQRKRRNYTQMPATSLCGANANGKQNICSTTHTTVRNLQFREAIGP